MTATPDMLTAITMGAYTVGVAATDTITLETFDQFLIWAETDAITDAIQTDYFDRAVSYKIADIIYKGLPGSDKASEKIGSTSYTKFDEQSQWMKSYMAIKEISDATTGTIPSKSVLRADETIVEFDSNPTLITYDLDQGFA